MAKIYADSPNFPRSRTKKLSGKLFETLALHILKVIAFPSNSAQGHWRKEVQTLLTKVLSYNTKHSHLMPKNYIIKRESLHLDIAEINFKLEEAIPDAYEELFSGKYKSLMEYLDPGFENLEFADMDIEIKEIASPDLGIQYRLLLLDQKPIITRAGEEE